MADVPRDTASDRAHQVALSQLVHGALSSSGPLDAMLDNCMAGIVSHFQASFSRVWLLNETEQVLELAASAGMPMPEGAQARRVPVGALLVGPIAQDREPYLTNDVVHDPRATAMKECFLERGIVSFVGYPLLVDGRVLGVLGMFASHPLEPDVLEALASVADAIAQGIARRQAEEALRASEAHLRAVLEHAGDVIAIKDCDCRYVLVNPATAAYFGVASTDDLLGRSPEELFTPEAASAMRALEERVMAEGVTHSQEILLTSRHGHERAYWVVKHPYFNSEGQLLGTIGVSRDITERKRLEAALQAQNQQLQELDAIKSNFVHSVSHELRTPLTSVIGYTELLEEGLQDVAPELLELTGLMKRSTGRIQRLVDDLLDYARIESGTFRLNFEAVDMVVPLRLAIESLQPFFKERKIGLETLLPDEPLALRTDPTRLEQVLLNLLSNALRYTPSGGQVTVAVEAQPDAVRVTVADTGTGIPAEKLGQVFERFYQADPHLHRAQGSAGLGLSICKAIVEGHGGTIGVESEHGQGASFWFTLPR